MSSPPPREKRSAIRIPGYYLALGLLLTMLAAVLASQYGISADSKPDDDAILMRIRPLADLELERLPVAVASDQRTGKVMFRELCQSCHGKGLDGAPGIGDRKAWAPRMDQGLDALAQSATAGMCGLSTRGGPLPEKLALARAIVYMIWPSMRL